MEIKDLETLFKEKGFTHFGWAKLEKPFSMEYYKSWVANDYHADMDYLKRHTEFKENPQKFFPKAQSAIVFTQNYYPIDSQNKVDHPLKKTKLAMYARQKDYHEWFLSKLNDLCEILKELYPEHMFTAYTDSKPVLERDLAYRAGLGWIGKNTCLIHEKKGSLFFIGEIYTTLKFKTKIDIHPDRCGTCTKCIDICPTQALVEPRVLDSNKCISYWTIESKKIAPQNLREKLGAWYFGCDLCQSICPWNQKFFKTEMQNELTSPTINEIQEIEKELIQILEASDQDLKTWFEGTPLSRAKPWAHKRNAIIVATNLMLKNLAGYIEKVSVPDNNDFKELINWSLNKLS